MFLLSLFLFWSYFCCLGDFSWKWEILLSLFLVFRLTAFTSFSILFLRILKLGRVLDGSGSWDQGPGSCDGSLLFSQVCERSLLVVAPWQIVLTMPENRILCGYWKGNVSSTHCCYVNMKISPDEKKMSRCRRKISSPPLLISRFPQVPVSLPPQNN